MKIKLFTTLALLGSVLAGQAVEALDVVVRGAIAQEWSQLLNQRGAKATAATDFPSAQQLEQANVLILAGSSATDLTAGQREALEKFVGKGGGIVTLGSTLISPDATWLAGLVGGAGAKDSGKSLEGAVSFYYVDKTHPITKEASNFEVKDAIAYDLTMRPEVHVLAAAYTPNAPNTEKAMKSTEGGKRPSVYDIQPQMWTYENSGHRSFVSILGNQPETTRLTHYRAVVLRGIAWAGKRENVDELCSKEELASLRYPVGGPTAPEKSAAKLELHPDFNISLVAAEPLINKPMAIDWDPQGRLWVAETPEYPNGRREHTRPEIRNATWKDAGSLVPGKVDRPATDRISILSNPDATGRFQNKAVFYEGLELVTGFVFYKDGVIVSQAPDILFLRDTNGDGKADKVEKLYTGLGIQDTHAVINNLRLGFDGWVYATHGYSSGNVTSGDRSKQFGKIGSGVVRFKPDGTAFEQYCSKGGNTWGLDIAWDGEVFFTQPTSGQLLNHIVMSEEELSRSKAGKTVSYKPLIVQRKSLPLITYDQQAYVQIDQVGMFTASAGCAIYSGGTWPKEWNYSYFTTEPTINILHHEVVESQGTSYSAHKTREAEFVGGRDMWFRPIETRIGPDGALYVLDFYNQAVIHNDTRGPIHGPANAAVRPDRDHYFGRIWKVDHKQAQKIKVPNLAKVGSTELVEGLQHPNLAVRETALRLIADKKPRNAATALRGYAISQKAPEFRVMCLWALSRMDALDSATLMTIANDSSSAVRKNALKAAGAQNAKQDGVRQLAGKLASDADARVRLEALLALGNFEVDAQTARSLALAYPKLEDEWLKAAFVGVAAKSPEAFLDAAFDSGQPEVFAGFAAEMVAQLATQQNGDALARIVALAASKPAAADPIKRAVLLSLAQNVKAGSQPRWTADLQKQLQTLLSSSNPGVASAALPLVVRWDRDKSLASETKAAAAKLVTQLGDSNLSDAQRSDAASALLELLEFNPEVQPALAKVLSSSASPVLKSKLIESLGRTSDAAAGQVLIDAFPRFDEETSNLAFDAIIKRSEWSLAFLNALDNGKVDATKLSPAITYRLRTHANAQVAQKAGSLVDRLRGPAVKQKGEMIARFVPIVSKPGNIAKGKELFTQNCATCHKLGDLGNEVGPILTGMGAHGPAELLVHILDPNREVDPSYVAYNVETKDDETYTGIISRENKASLFVKNAGGVEKEIPRGQIKSQRSTGLSLMPEGFEALGGESLRDILTFVCGDSARFRFIDLSPAFTADTRTGLFSDEKKTDESIPLKKFGPVTVDGIPFNIVDPARSAVRKNVVVLKGGHGYAATLPQRVEMKVGFAASRLHFLGGIGGWAFPGGGKLPALKATVHYTDGDSEELVMRNGEEFADYIGQIDVPGSRFARGVVDSRQVRWFTKPLKSRAMIDHIVLESFGNQIAPVTVAITAETGEGPLPAGVTVKVAAETKSPRIFQWGEGVRVLLMGGGSSHNFERYFHQADEAILSVPGKVTVHYTEDPAELAANLKSADVLGLSSNQNGLPTPEVRKALFDFVEAGKGLVLMHPGLWYNYKDWPEYNRVLAAGGAMIGSGNLK
ncbi:MAG: hypothetical protein JWM16_1809 [Verrucomicrobiales bacterium]|nr:hypothetical protein [Verrucomicrobiales bacterium]